MFEGDSNSCVMYWQAISEVDVLLFLFFCLFVHSFVFFFNSTKTDDANKR